LYTYLITRHVYSQIFKSCLLCSQIGHYHVVDATMQEEACTLGRWVVMCFLLCAQ